MSLPCKCSKDAKIQRWQGLSQIDAVMDGKRRGKTDSDYLYFLCPRCADNPLLQILEYDIPREGPVERAPQLRPLAKWDFVIALKLWRLKCGFTDFVKVSNLGWYSGKLTEKYHLIDSDEAGLYSGR